MRVRDGHVLLLTPFSRFAFHPDWSVRNLIVFATYDFFVDPPRNRASNIVTIRPDGTQERQLTRIRPGDDGVGQPTFTPDGQRIIFTYQDESGRHAAFIAAQGGRIRLVPTSYTGPVTNPRLSPTAEPCSHRGDRSRD